jgi:signal transduction histidine kinase
MRLSLLLFLCLFFGRASSQVILIDQQLPYKSLGQSVSYFKDDSARLNLSEVIHLDQQRKFTRSDVPLLNFGNSGAAWWVKISYLYRLTDRAHLVLDIATIDSIDFFSKTSTGKYHHLHTGSVGYQSPELTSSNNYIFNLNDDSHGAAVQTVYLRLRSNNILIVPLKIAICDTLITGLNTKERLEAIYTGILIALFFFNFFVFISSRDRTYFYYSLYILALFFYVVFYVKGYGYLFGHSFRQFINAYPHIFLGVGTIAGIIFSSSFLNLKVVLPQSGRFIQALIAIWLSIILIGVLGFKSLGCSLAQLFSAISTITLWFLGLIAYSKGYKPALYYLVAWAFVSLATMWLVLNLVNVFPYSELTFHLAPLGFVFELLLLSLAMGDRLKDLKKGRQEIHSDKLKMQEENLYLISTQNERLEKVVDSRTKALKKIVQSLEAANADKNRLFSIIAHDLRSPFNSLISLLSLNDMDLLTFEDVKMLLNDSRRNIDNIHNTLNNLLYWAQSQMQGITTAPSRFNMRVLIDDLFLVYQPLLTRKNIKIEFIVDKDDDVYADLNQINLVMRNLIDNAIKFTPHNQFIRIRVWGADNSVYVDVCNPVVGTPDITKLSAGQEGRPTYGTSNERGVGLGLHLCRDFVERNNGTLRVSKVDNCVVLRFCLPKAG